MTDYAALFGKKLSEIRAEKGISQDKLALKCGVARSFIGDTERGKRNLTLKNIIKLSVGLGVLTSDLLALVDEEVCKAPSETSTNSDQP